MMGMIDIRDKDYLNRELEFHVYKSKPEEPYRPGKPFLFQIQRGTAVIYAEYLSEADFRALRRCVYFEVREV